MTVQTDNSFFEEKVLLRIQSIEKLSKIVVLDCFSGEGTIWKEVKRRTKKDISSVRMDMKGDRSGIYLKGDNRKFLLSMDLSEFDVIDLDAYGSPFNQLEIILKRKYKGIIHCTFIQTMFGGVNKDLLQKLGYSRTMIDKIPTLFNKDGMSKMGAYLGTYKIPGIMGCFIDKKNYFYFSTVDKTVDKIARSQRTHKIQSAP